MKEYIINKERFSNSKILLYTLTGMIFVFIGAQLFVLTRVGTQGEKLNQIKLEQTRLRIENEIKQAEVSKLQSRKEILGSVENLGMKETEVIIINNDIRTAEAK